MLDIKSLFALILGLWVTHSVALTQDQLDKIAEQLVVRYQVVDNASQVECDTHLNNGRCFVSRLRYQNGSITIPEEAKVYFSHISPIAEVDDHQVTIKHLKGDLHVLTFLGGLEAGHSVEFTVKAPFWHAARSDVMPNQYIAYGDLKPATIRTTMRQQDPYTRLSFASHAGNWISEQQYRRTSKDSLVLGKPEVLYDSYPEAWPVRSARGVLPEVSSRHDSGKNIPVSAVAIPRQHQQWLAPAILTLSDAGVRLSDTGLPVTISIASTPSGPAAAYELSIDATGIDISATSPIAAQYALVTTAQLYNKDTSSLPATRISDRPRFEFRGLHLDVARHFPGKETIDVVIEQMFLLKLNVLHLHLSDDEGWRVEIPGLPELTETGGFRCHDLTETHCLLPQLGSGPDRDAKGNGFLSVSEYQSILTKAASRGIEVIPSFDMPGHARAAIRSMDARYRRFMAAGDPDSAKEFLLSDPEDTTRYLSIQYYNDNAINPCQDSSYRFIERVLTSLKDIHKEAGVPLRTYHLGADETAGAWKSSPQCLAKRMDPEYLRAYFVSRVVKMGNALGLTMAGWSDGMEDSLEKLSSLDVQVNIWDALFFEGTDKVNGFAKAGIPTVLSLPDVLYFDFPYHNNPDEPGYYWGSKSTSERKVFEFMPARLEQHQYIWPDRMGNAYKDHAEHTRVSELRGIQAQLWTEVTPDRWHVEYMLFPRLLAFAERAWHLADWQTMDVRSPEFTAKREDDWHRFSFIVAEQFLPELVSRGINVRIPPPGAVMRQGVLHMRSAYPGLVLEYSVDGNNWQHYQRPVRLNVPPKVRSRLSEGDVSSPVRQL